MTRIARALLFSIVIVISLAAGYYFFHEYTTHEETDDAYVVGHIHYVSPKVAGIVKEVLVNDNQLVNKGETLVCLEQSDEDVAIEKEQTQLRSALKDVEVAATRVEEFETAAVAQRIRAAADIDESAAAVSSAQERMLEAKTQVAATKEQLLQAQATSKKNLQDFERYTYLQNQGAVSKQQRDHALHDLTVAQRSVQIARHAMNQAESRVAALTALLSQAKAHARSTRSEMNQAELKEIEIMTARKQHQAALCAVQEAEVNLSDALLQKTYTRILAPVKGKIGGKAVEVGQHVEPGERLLAVVSDDVWVVANFKETQLERMSPGQTVRLKIDAFPHQIFSGRISSFSPASNARFSLLPAENATGNFTKIVQRVPVKIVFDRSSLARFHDRVVPGMSVVASIKVSQEPLLFLPSSSK
ncbi:MAG: HlyD family secretion protein [Cyanobacteria bacterium]|nr:HlyD family secretion protein [Cyanobacteriota bacterium]